MLEHLVLVAFLQVASPSAPTPPTADAAKPEQLICKTERMTGSNIRKQKVCLTKEERAEIAERARDLMGTLNNGANVQPKPPPGPAGGGGPG